MNLIIQSLYKHLLLKEYFLILLYFLHKIEAAKIGRVAFFEPEILIDLINFFLPLIITSA